MRANGNRRSDQGLGLFRRGQARQDSGSGARARRHVSDNRLRIGNLVKHAMTISKQGRERKSA